MSELDSWLERYGLKVLDPQQLDEIRARLAAETDKERHSQGEGDTELMRLCAVQLFGAGNVEDALVIWRAKSASMDANGAIDVQLLCGAGLERTKAFLSERKTAEAARALERIATCERSGDFEGFSPEREMTAHADYYR